MIQRADADGKSERAVPRGGVGRYEVLRTKYLDTCNLGYGTRAEGNLQNTAGFLGLQAKVSAKGASGRIPRASRNVKVPKTKEHPKSDGAPVNGRGWGIVATSQSL